MNKNKNAATPKSCFYLKFVIMVTLVTMVTVCYHSYIELCWQDNLLDTNSKFLRKSYCI